ncbi:unnamed protein product [Moneuplotes crassus]|uniref:MIP18 family-like domain-containing protein n=2 Tax=Euplotes crassus TaxID=5936 RepID=A0AAD1XW60_EUPCR|nr:unnamed protein product [Moneuplotes crassus]
MSDPNTLENPNPLVQSVPNPNTLISKARIQQELDEDVDDEFDALEVFELIRHINDPEHPLTLEQLNVVSHKLIEVDLLNSTITVLYTPTIPHCSQAILIGLMLRVKLYRSLPERFKVDIMIEPGKHASEHAINKQLNDKERVAAALENKQLLNIVNQGLRNSDRDFEYLF